MLVLCCKVFVGQVVSSDASTASHEILQIAWKCRVCIGVDILIQLSTVVVWRLQSLSVAKPAHCGAPTAASERKSSGKVFVMAQQHHHESECG